MIDMMHEYHAFIKFESSSHCHLKIYIIFEFNKKKKDNEFERRFYLC